MGVRGLEEHLIENLQIAHNQHKADIIYYLSIGYIEST